LETFLTHRQLDGIAREAGGILLGRLVLSTDDVIIDRVSTPVPEDRRSRFRFWRAKHPAQQTVRKAWADSKQSEQYLGEWHTHPERMPTPSGVDRSDWERLLKETVCEHDVLFFVIVGTRSVCAWEGSRLSGEVTSLGDVPLEPG
jgi:integrative and conjugative element protein (TIGR02256 family)